MLINLTWLIISFLFLNIVNLGLLFWTRVGETSQISTIAQVQQAFLANLYPFFWIVILATYILGRFSLNNPTLRKLLLYGIPVAALIIFFITFLASKISFPVSFFGYYGWIRLILLSLHKTMIFVSVALLPPLWTKEKYEVLENLNLLKRSFLPGIITLLIFNALGILSVFPSYKYLKQRSESRIKKIEEVKSTPGLLPEPTYIPTYLIKQPTKNYTDVVQWEYDFTQPLKGSGYMYQEYLIIEQKPLEKTEQRLATYPKYPSPKDKVTDLIINGHPARLVERGWATELVWETNTLFIWIQNQRPDLLQNEELLKIAESMR